MYMSVLYRIVILPSLALLRQFYESYTEKTRPPLRECQVKALAACSQDKSVVNISMCTGAGKSRVITECLPHDGKIGYYATDGTLAGIPKISTSMPVDIILTTYVSAPRVYDMLSKSHRNVHVIHDEAHHITSPIYWKSYDAMVEAGLIQKSINFSATLPEGYECDYVYPLLRGIKDGIVRDFHIKAIACLAGDDRQSFINIVNLARDWARTQRQTLRLLVYTSEANTDSDVETEGGTSVRSFLECFASAARDNGWWMRGLHKDTMGEREEILREFEDTNPDSGIAILVSCRTLSEGVDLKNANAMLPWDPSSDAKTNIQRIGRILRKLKNARGEYLPAEQQTPSLVVVPVWLDRDVYLKIKGDSARIHKQLYKDMKNGTRGSFAPLLNVIAALKSELMLEDDELFRKVINFPSKPKSGTFTGNVLDVVARSLKKKPRDLVREMGELELLDDDTKETLGAWVDAPKDEKECAWEEIPEEEHGTVLNALVASQDLTLLVEQEKGGVPEVFGSGSIQKTLERKPDGSYAVSRRKRETPAEKKAKKEVQKRVSLCTTESCRVVLGLEEGAFEDGKSFIQLTTRIECEGESDYVWNKRFEQWKAFAEKKGSTPVVSDIDKDGNRVGKWQHAQLFAYKKGKLSVERIRLLEACEYWKWEGRHTWDTSFELWKAFAEKKGSTPVRTDIDDRGNKVGVWQDSQRFAYKKGKLSVERIRLLEECEHWKWKVKNTTWMESWNNWKVFAEAEGETPLQSDIDDRGNKVGVWQNSQRMKYKKGKLTPEQIRLLNDHPLWSWESPPSRTIKRKRKPPKKTSNSSTTSPKHIASQLETYHKKYKSMNSATYFSHIKESPSDWEEYHKIADEYDKRDAPEHSPHHRIANFIPSIGYPAGTPAIDLGCGRDRLRDDAKVSHLDWTSVDAVPASERVVQADLGSLPMSDNTYQLAIISRALWARKPDHMTQLCEAERILRPGGMLVLCESRRKWVEEIIEGRESGNTCTTTVNHLENAVRDAGFVITTRSKDDDKSVWQFLVCQKPMIGGI